MPESKAAPHSGKFAFGEIRSPKEEESSDGINVNTEKALPQGAAHPDKSGHK